MMMDSSALWFDDESDDSGGDVFIDARTALLPMETGGVLQDGDSFPRFGGSLSVFPSSDGLFSGGLEDGVSLPRSGLPSAWNCFCQWVKAQNNFSDKDLQKLKPFFVWIPIETIKTTLNNTTQYAKAVSNYPIVKHMVARFKMLNRYRLDEVVFMDTVFS
jgi:hypothetical protein